ncbi:hypothetical protein CLV92_10643 [Kineococcus xinjiangensis]|uniref:Uncharacterized protein n=1 Tax=Kineococcus xinjiangensis TaxID=512762 RepID=A0A2S6ILW0_9ACTN|nr:hypothetical protein [Kineococcus xinjiangensis]PPK95222.1 hypothetical protein CLV92_10643 [Kineococcus xinjiangensis]
MRRARVARPARAARTVLLVQVGAGPLVGAAWWAITHDPPGWLGGEPHLTRGSLDAARDGALAVLGGLLGSAAALRVLRRPGTRPLRTLAAAVLGALLGAALAVATAALLPAGVDGQRVLPRAWGVALSWPLLLVGVVFVRTFGESVAEWVQEGSRSRRAQDELEAPRET